MKRTRMFLVAGVATVCSAGVAFATHVEQVDPATVPTGFLVAHNKVEGIRVSSVARAVEHRKADVFVQHVRLTAKEATPWHTHPGPVFVQIVKGSLTVEEEHHGKCSRLTYGPGRGFFDRGFGHVHRAVAGPDGADFYPVYVLPPGSATQLLPAAAPEECIARGESEDDSHEHDDDRN
jgi:hypothetical protein